MDIIFNIIFTIAIVVFFIFLAWSFIIKPICNSTDELQEKANELKLNPNDKKDEYENITKNAYREKMNQTIHEMLSRIIKPEIRSFLLATILDTDSSLLDHQKTEIFPLIYVIADMCAANTGFDRTAVKNIVLEELHDFYDTSITKGKITHTDIAHQLLDSWIDKRSQIYGEIIRGHQLKGLCFFGNSKTWTDANVIFKCCILLGDFLLSEDFENINDYDSKPIAVPDIFEAEEMCLFVTQISVVATTFYNNLYRVFIRMTRRWYHDK